MSDNGRSMIGGLTVTSTETCCRYSDLDLALVWGPEGTWFKAEVLGTMEHGGVLGWEGNRRHGEDVG